MFSTVDFRQLAGSCYADAMKRDTALAIIKRHEADLKQLGVVSLSLFGSTARDQAIDKSDVDVAVRLPLGDDEGGLAWLGRLDRVKDYLSRILAVPVDVVPEPASHPRLGQQIEQDRSVAF